jgi:hypothetical protein
MTAAGRKDRAGLRSGALGLVEEAFYLLRRVPPVVHAIYLVGTVPFVLGLVFFVTEMARSPVAGPRLVPWSLGLAVLYLWMKVWQSAYAAALFGELSPGGAGVRPGGGGWWRRAAALLAVQVFSAPAHLVAAVLTLPVGWTVAFFQAASVVAFLPAAGGRRSWRRLVALSGKLSHHRALQNHLALLVLSLFWVVVWLAVVSVFAVVPVVFKVFTGVETVFTRSPAAALGSTTTLSVTLSLSLLATGPLAKAAFVVRAFYALAESTGDDLRARLRALAADRGAGAGRLAAPLAVAVVWLGLSAWAPQVAAGGAAGPAGGAEVAGAGGAVAGEAGGDAELD